MPDDASDEDEEGLGILEWECFGDEGGVAKGRELDEVELLRDDVAVALEPGKAGAMAAAWRRGGCGQC